MGIGTILNIALSIVLGGILPSIVSWLSPSIGVAIGTVTTDILILVFLFAITWKWIKNALFNKNTLKLLIANFVIGGISFAIYRPLLALWKVMGLSISTSYILQLVTTIVVAGIIYIVILAVLKEDLVYSFIRKKDETSVEQ